MGFINKLIITQYVIIITIYESCERDKCFAQTSETSSLDFRHWTSVAAEYDRNS